MNRKPRGPSPAWIAAERRRITALRDAARAEIAACDAELAELDARWEAAIAGQAEAMRRVLALAEEQGISPAEALERWEAEARARSKQETTP